MPDQLGLHSAVLGQDITCTSTMCSWRPMALRKLRPMRWAADVAGGDDLAASSNSAFVSRPAMSFALAGPPAEQACLNSCSCL